VSNNSFDAFDGFNAFERGMVAISYPSFDSENQSEYLVYR